MFKPIVPLIALAALLGPSAARADDSAPTPTAVHLQPVQQPVTPVAVTPPGQWVFTTQYGWLWLPYEQGYTYVSPDASFAYMYTYNPTFGWRWVGAPWVLGVGPSPRWGVYGTAHFAFYSHPWFRGGVGYRGGAEHRGSGGHGFAAHPTRGSRGGGAHGRR